MLSDGLFDIVMALAVVVRLCVVTRLAKELVADLHYWGICRKQRRLTKAYEARRMAHEGRR